MAGKFELYKETGGKFRFRLKASTSAWTSDARSAERRFWFGRPPPGGATHRNLPGHRSDTGDWAPPRSAPFVSPRYTETLTGKVAIQAAVPRKTMQPTTSNALRVPAPRSLVLIPAKNRATANMTTART